MVGIFFALDEIHDRSGRRRDQLRQAIRYLRPFRLSLRPPVPIPVILRILLLAVAITAFADLKETLSVLVVVDVLAD
jgi:hypothetical protein